MALASPYLEYKRFMTYSRSSDRGATETAGLCIRKQVRTIQGPRHDPGDLGLTNTKIYVDAARPATLNDGAGKLTDYPALQEAVTAWHRLRPEQTKRATIKVIGGPVYTAHEIERLHYRPKPA
jgi:hypothetical protein